MTFFQDGNQKQTEEDMMKRSRLVEKVRKEKSAFINIIVQLGESGHTCGAYIKDFDKKRH